MVLVMNTCEGPNTLDTAERLIAVRRLLFEDMVNI